jgi:hypothetical protein
MNALVSYIFAAMIYWVPMTDHAYYEKPEVTQARYTEIATTIAEVALDPNTVPLFEGDDGRVKTALLLASVASSEGFFRKDVDSCKVGGDNGLAWGLWQTHANKKKVCSDRKVAATIALDMMRNSLQSCKSFNLMDRMSVYTDGSCHANWQRSRFKMGRAITWYSKHKPETLTVALED